ncbi:MAG: HD domain-containing phosphohydrolase [Candidatus Limnocylindrales bacterium]
MTTNGGGGGMPRALKLVLVAVIGTAIALVAASTLTIPPDAGIGGVEGVLFWMVVVALSSALPVRMPGGALVNVVIGPMVAVAALGGPTAAVLVAAVGTLELRELRGLVPGHGGVPWYGTLYNHAEAIIPAFAAGLICLALGTMPFEPSLKSLIVVVGAGLSYFLVNNALAALAMSAREGSSLTSAFAVNVRQFGVSLAGLAPLAWLMASMWVVAGPIGVLPFAVPLFATRAGYKKIVEIRDMFTQTVRSLAGAVDAKDPYTAGHSERVQLIAKDLGAEMRCSDSELEALEWGGLLHDIGKIGIPDAILLKQGSLTREERVVMNSHPVKGEEIIRPVAKLKPELPIIRHHHEWFNGSGYPDRLMGHDIPKLARIMHVADSFEAMTAARPYRMTPLTEAQAIEELHKFTGIQFDPEVVAAFDRLISRRPEWAKPNIPRHLLEQEKRHIPRIGEAGPVPA